MERLRRIEPEPKVLATKELLGNFYIVTEAGVYCLNPVRNLLVKVAVDAPQFTVAEKPTDNS